ncbi:MAG: hypothetical protein Q7U47_14445 [Paludibacter sp.]|nr:hypothetical protein [Paludibacter sp.]
MKLKTVFILSHLLAVSTLSFAQSPNKISVNVEFGGNQVNTSLNEKWNIRQDVGPYYYESGSSNIAVSPYMFVSHLGIKPEIAFFENKLALSSGLRFSNISSDLSIIGQSAEKNKFFYLRYHSTGLDTEFARVRSISESSNYLGIPFDVKLIPFSISQFNFYLKTGVELNFKVGSKTNIDFVSEEMKGFENSIIENIGVKVNSLYSTWTTALGVRFGSKDKLKYKLEFLLPSFFITKNYSTLVNGDMFTGFQCAIQLPVK